MIFLDLGVPRLQPQDCQAIWVKFLQERKNADVRILFHPGGLWVREMPVGVCLASAVLLTGKHSLACHIQSC